MKANKIGTIFLVSVLALAGIGISYSGFVGTLNIFGTVQTASVGVNINKYSGTWVWKVFDAPDTGYGPETVVTHDPAYSVPSEDGFLVSWAIARAPTGSDPPGYDVIVDFHNLIPNIDYEANIEFTIGTIPVKFTEITIAPLTGSDWIGPLIASGNIYAKLYVTRDKVNVPVFVGTQVHPDEVVTGEVHITIPQNNNYQGLSGSGSATFGIEQWNDQCNPILESASISDYVWNDLNQNGLQDINEPGLSGVTVNLMDGTGTSVLDTTTSDSLGFYSFTNLAAGNYVVQFLQKSGYQFTSFMSGSDATIDSNANSGNSGKSNVIVLAAGESDNTIDCGQYLLPVDVGITKTVNNQNPNVGDQITFTITAHNYGPGVAMGVVVNDLLPSGLTYVSHLASQGTYDHSTGVWNVGTINNGNDATLTITATVIGGGSGGGFTQLALVIDGSGSISSSDWTIMKSGLANAIINFCPHDGSVELTVVEFAGQFATLEVAPVVITSSNFNTVATAIQGIVKRGSYTPLACGLKLAADKMKASPNYDSSKRQVINIVTDGQPNISWDSNYFGYYVGMDLGKNWAAQYRNYTISLLGMTSDGVSFNQDEIDVEAVGTDVDLNWLTNTIAFPQPGYGSSWPPAKPGWVRHVDSYTEFANTVHEKFVLILAHVINCASLTNVIPADTNSANDQYCITIQPH